MNYLDPLIKELQKKSDKQNAFFMSKYMKNKFPFFGIKTPERTIIFKEFIREHGLPEEKNISAIIKKIWSHPEREAHYCGIDLLFRSIKSSEENRITLYEYMILNKSWWDTVDAIAKIIGIHFNSYPKLIKPFTQNWMRSGNIWLQRVCVIYQLGYKDNTDFEMMKKNILKLKNSNEFFIQKGIGWALREYSKTYPDAVKEFIHSANLKPLSVREGLKWIKKIASG